MSELLHLRAEIERLRADVERFKASAGMWRNKCYELGGTPLPWEPEELIQKAVEAEREVLSKSTDDRIQALRRSMHEAAAEQLEHFRDIQFLIKCGRKNERELIASWVADMCQGLDANTIAEAIRNGGNDAVDNFKASK